MNYKHENLNRKKRKHVYTFIDITCEDNKKEI